MRLNFSIYTAITCGVLIIQVACSDKEGIKQLPVKKMEPELAAQAAKSIEGTVSTQLAEGLTLSLWAVDSLVADPVSLDVDDQGRVYYIRTNRQKNSEFDIRGHQDWEIASVRLQSVEDKRKFLHTILSPENSDKNVWLQDVNKDGSHDWKDLTVEKEDVYRLEDVSGDGIADVSQMVVNDFNTEVTDAAGALLATGDDLYVGIAPDLWRMIDKNEDGIADDKESISHGYGIHIGFGGHGMSGLEMGPEGKLYWQIGDIGFNGKGPDGQTWEHPNSGVIVRANPDGTDFEVFSYGNRNTHEFVFDEYANLISEDNDGDHPGESERIVYVVNGADIGWRINWQFGKYRDPDNNTYKVWMDEKMYIPRFEGQAAYIIPPLANYVNGPTGMLYNPGTALSPEWKNTFFIGEFVGNPAKSGIHAFKLKPKGARFELGESKSIMSGVLATGIDFGPDGAMYVADWLEGWGTKDHGRIWKLDVKDGASSEIRKQTKQLLGEDFKKYDEGKLSDLLKHEDLRVRQKSQFELVKRGTDGLRILEENSKQKEHQLARVNSIWGISQFARKDLKHGALLIPLLQDSDPEIRAQAAKWLGDVRYKAAGEKLIPLLKDENSRVRFFAAEALGRIAHAAAVQPIIEFLRANNDEDEYLRHAGSLALARIGNADAIRALSKDESKAVRIAAVVALRRMKHVGVADFLADTDEFVVTEAARAINDDLNIQGALPTLGDLLTTTKFKNEALIRRSINANLEVGTEKSMQNLMDYASKNDTPLAMRVEAIDALSTWIKPSVLDRVDGRYRGELTRDPSLVRAKSLTPLTTLTSNKDASVRLSATKALGKLGISEASTALLSRLKSDQDAQVRTAALRSLAATHYKEIGNAIQQALNDKDKMVRIAGLDLLPQQAISNESKVTMLEKVINSGTTEEKQAALTTLGTLPFENTNAVFDRLLVKLSQGKLSSEIDFEFAEAIDSTKSAPLIDRYKKLSVKSGPDSLFNTYRGALAGGDVSRGRNIFFGNQTAQCLRCHSFDDLGGNAGPRLNGVASRLSQQQLLEALIIPSKRIAPGFGSVTVELKDGTKINGLLMEETSTNLRIKVGEKPDTLLAKTGIAKFTQGGSSMPPMHLLLSKKEIRDLVSFLATLKD